MPSQPAKPRRLVFPPLTDDQQMLFIFDHDFPKDQRKPEAERVLAARRRGKSTGVVVPVGMHVHVRERGDQPWHPIEPLTEVGRCEFPGGPPDLPPSLPSKEPPRRGRPRRQSRLSRINQGRKPTGDWLDDEELARDVAVIVGRRDERLDDGAEILPRLCRFSSRLLGRKLSRGERDALRALVLLKRAPASVITRVLVGWRHGLGERDVRRMLKTLNQPKTPRPRVKLIYR